MNSGQSSPEVHVLSAIPEILQLWREEYSSGSVLNIQSPHSHPQRLPFSQQSLVLMEVTDVEKYCRIAHLLPEHPRSFSQAS